MQQILVTGATGFLGRHLVPALVAAGHRVAVLVRESSDLAVLDEIGAELDVRPTDGSGQTEGCSTILHLATDYGRHTPASAVCETNIMLPLRLLEEGLAGELRTFVNTDTILPRGLTRYSLSKAQLVEWAKLAVGHPPLAWVNIELQQMIGPGDGVGDFYMRVIRDCLAGVPSIAMSGGEQSRDYTWIGDVVTAYVAVLGQEHAPGFHGYPVGTGEPHMLREVVELIRELTGAPTQFEYGAVPYRAGEPMRMTADTTRLRALGWAPTMSLEGALRAVLAHYCGQDGA